MSSSRKLATFAAALAAGTCPLAHADDWDWSVAPYLWAATNATDLSMPNRPPVGSVTTFSDLVDKLDGAAQVHVEGQGDQWGVFADFTYIATSDKKGFPVATADTDLDQILFEAAAVWSPGEGRFRGVDLFAGLRYLDTDVTVDLDPADPTLGDVRIDASDSYADFMLGARYTWVASDRWRVIVRGDGSWGDTEGTWNASILAEYRVKYGAWGFGYRYLDIGLESGDADIDITMQGPVVGFGFAF